MSGAALARLGLIFVIGALLVCASWNYGRPAFGSMTFTVNSTGDSGDASPGDGNCDDGSGNCTLRAAIEESNALAGADTINFSIGGGGSIQTISPATELPIIVDPVNVDGTTQWGGSYGPIELDGSLCTGCAYGLAVSASSSVIAGFTINSFTGIAAGVAFIGPGGGNTVQHSFLGTNTSGSAADGNGAGVFIGGSSNNVIRGNTISGNGYGVWIAEFGGVGATGNTVMGNAIGTDGAGNFAILNTGPGVNIDGTGTQAVSGNQIGMSGGVGNAIAGNGGAGIYINGAMASGNNVAHNAIGEYCHGSCVTSATAIPNGSHGVYISGGAHDNIVGGPNPLLTANDIAFNHGAGVAIDGGGARNGVQWTTIHDNDGLGIDLAPLGSVTSFVVDSGLTSALYCPNCFGTPMIALTGYIRGGPPNTAIANNGYRSDSCDPSGFGEGQFFLANAGATSYGPPNGIATDADGNVSGAGAIVNPGPQSNFTNKVFTVSATLPDGSTTEFSNCVPIKIDSDSDGIQDEIDTAPGTFSNDSTDVPLGGGGTSFATIIDRAGCYVSIYELPNPDGAAIGTICPQGGGPATIRVCGIANITLQNGTSVNGKCGSVHTNVDFGPVTETFGAFTATLPTKTLSTITRLSPTSYSVNNDATSAAAITVDCTSIAPGNTVTFNDTDGDGLGDDVETNTGINNGPCDRGTNPNVADTDGDGLSDGAEVNGVTTESAGVVHPNPNVADTDGDGCPDGNEVGQNQFAGGRRDPTNQWDYFNPEKVNTPHKQTLSDIQYVVNQYGKNQGNAAYTTATDRTFSGPNVWNLGPPDGKQTVSDILAAVDQYQHNCP